MAGIEDAKRLAALVNRNPSAIDQKDLAQLLATQTALNRITDRLTQPYVTPDEFAAGMKSLGGELTALVSQIESLAGDVSKRPVSFEPVLKAFGPVLTAVNGLAKKLDQMIGALGRIEIPTPVIPEMDLSPVLASNESIKAMIAQLIAEESEPEEVEEKPREWVFDVKRNQSGLIRTVEVREV